MDSLEARDSVLRVGSWLVSPEAPTRVEVKTWVWLLRALRALVPTVSVSPELSPPLAGSTMCPPT